MSAHAYFMPKKDGYLAASDIPEVGIVTTIDDIVKVDEIPNRICLKTAAYPDDLLILTKGDSEIMVNQIGSAESDDWLGRQIHIERVVRQFSGRPVWGMKVRAVA